MTLKKWTLLDADTGGTDPKFLLTAAELGISGHEFHVRQSRLRGGLQEGVDSIEIDNGRFSFVVLPTRGMGIWKGWLGKRGTARHDRCRLAVACRRTGPSTVRAAGRPEWFGLFGWL